MALTALTLAVIGVVVVTMTPMGCGPTHALGMTAKGDRCANRAAAETPFPKAKPGYVAPPYTPPPFTPYSPPPSPPPPTPPENGPNPSAYPPYFPPSSPGGTFTPALSLSCRLPVYAGGSGSGGFIQFPAGTFVADPASAVSLPAGAPTPPPMGMGQMSYYGSLSYVSAFSKWLPVPLTWVSPDGSRYAFPSGSSIWVQNVADSGHVVLGDGQQQWAIVGFLSDGVYASAGPNSPGLWLLPLAGPPRQIATTGFWRAAAAGAAYGTATAAVPQGASNPILRLDLKTGAITDWFKRGNSQINLLGFDAQGHPLVQVYYQSPPGGTETWLTTGPSTAVLLGGSSSPPAAGQPPLLNGAPLGDSHGVWFQANAQNPTPPASNVGMVLYVAGSGIYWMTNISGQPAGGCN